MGVIGIAIVIGAFAWYSRGLPEIFKFEDYQPKQVSRILDAKGHVLAELYEEKRTVIPMEEIPQVMRNAMIAAEDANFMQHQGLDYFGILRAVLVNIRRCGFAQGSSTITQQVVKNLLLTPKKELKRKFQEVLLSYQLEKRLSKDEILAIYLNHVYFGHRINGIEEAALFYFDKHAKDLTLNEAATLAGIVQSPERLSPRKHMERAIKRRNYVLKQLRENGFISENVYRTTLDQEIVLGEKRKVLRIAPYFVEHVKEQLIAQYGRDYVYTAGLKVVTTLDSELQALANQAVMEGLYAYDKRHYLNRPLKNPKNPKIKRYQKGHNYEAVVASVEGKQVMMSIAGKTLPLKYDSRVLQGKKAEEVFKKGKTWFVRVTQFDAADQPAAIAIRKGPQASLVAVDLKTRGVLAMVGGESFAKSSFNRATQAKRQVGSAFKPFVFAAALEKRLISPATVINDAPKVFHIPGKKKPWSPQNADHKFRGPMTTRTALNLSRNTIAVDILERVGIPAAQDFARKIGIRSALADNFTLALGSSELSNLEVTNAYATLADDCHYTEPIMITEISTRHGALPLVEPENRRRVCSSQTSYLITSMLHSVTTNGTARRRLAKRKPYFAGKTGTTNRAKDTWFLGYSSSIACGVYVGFDSPKPMGRGEGGGTTALPIWAQFMVAAHKGQKRIEPSKPADIIEVSVDKSTGLLCRDPKNCMSEVFVKGTEPTTISPSPDTYNQGSLLMQQLGNVEDENQPSEDDVRDLF